jgi:calcyphosin
LFQYFDKDRSGEIDFEEFLQGVRGPMSQRRIDLVHLAFNKIDKDKNGVLEPDDIIGTYDASRHPDVLAGKRTANEVLREFLDTFDIGGVVDGKVTKEEFVNYYANIGASIDSDDYFELMIRNAWHISGGQGWSANSANKRVLATRADGSQTVVEIEDDLGLKAGDAAGAMARLRKQKFNASSISFADAAGDTADEMKTSSNRKSTTANRNNNPLLGGSEDYDGSMPVGRKYLAQRSQFSLG